MKHKPYEPINDGHDAERFVHFAKKLISVPKAEIDRRMEVERQEKEKASRGEVKKQRS